MDIDQAILEAVNKFKASHDGQVAARLQVKRTYQEKLGTYYSLGENTILIDYVNDLEDGEVRCIGADVHQAVTFYELPDWASKERK